METSQPGQDIFVPDIQKQSEVFTPDAFKMAMSPQNRKGQKNAAPTIAGTAPLVDDKGLEPLTSRTSSGMRYQLR